MKPACDVLLLMGPTAAGKTELAMSLARQLDGEIISVDSALVYRGLDIGTAKPDAAMRAEIPHHLLDIRDPAEPYSAADFCRDARRVIEVVRARGKFPILAGGTMLYFKMLVEGMAEMPAVAEPVRQQLLQEWQQLGAEKLHEELCQADPEAARVIHPRNQQRLIRALEVWRATGQPISHFWRKTERDFPWSFMAFGMMPESRSLLHERIAHRFDAMLTEGFEQEVRALYQRGDLHPDLPAIRAVGYRQMWGYLAGEYDFEEMRQKALAATRQLAKRQLTWLRKWPDLCWFSPNDRQLLDKALKALQIGTI